VKIDAQHAIAHNKVMIIDGETVITGSFNFTKAAEETNAENLLVIQDKRLASAYTKNCLEHEKHSEVYTGREESGRSEGIVVQKVMPGSESKLNEYYSLIWKKIKDQWTIPEGHRKEMAGLETVIVLKIDRGGKVKEMRYEKRSGNPQYDQIAWQAIKKAEPFPPFPKEFGGDTFEI
jgi:TonB family protein